LDMVGALLAASRPRPRPTAIRFNAKGGVWQAIPPFPELGAQGFLEIHVRDSIAEPLRLAGRIASVGPDGRVKVRFAALSENVADLLEKLAFRKHRRQVAGIRMPKK
jgi:hypothetical protein